MKAFKMAPLLLVAACGSSFAGSMGEVVQDHRMYVSALVTYNFLDFSSANTSSFVSPAQIVAPAAAIQDNVGYNVGIGYRFNPYFRAAFTASGILDTNFAVADQVETSLNGQVDIYNYMAAGYLSPFQFDNGFEPYVMGGVGVAHLETSDIYFPLANQVEFGAPKNQFSWQAGIGSLYRLSNNFDLDLNYNYVSYGRATNSGNYNTVGDNGVPAVGAPTRLNSLYSNQIAVGLHYRFA